MRKRNYLDRVEISKLSENGKLIIEVARRQSEHLNFVMRAKDGFFSVHIGDEMLGQNSDTLRILLVSKISYRERWATYGVECCLSENISHMGDYGLPIPTEEYLSLLVKRNDLLIRRPHYEDIVIPRKLLYQFWNGKISVETLINQFAEYVLEECKTYQFDFR